MKVSRTLIVVGSLLLILSIVLTYKWIAYNHAYPKAQTELTNSTKKANLIDSKAKNKKHVQNSLAKKAAKSVANQSKFYARVSSKSNWPAKGANSVQGTRKLQQVERKR